MKMLVAKLVARGRSIPVFLACLLGGSASILAAEPKLEPVTNRSVDPANILDSFKIDGNGNVLLLPVMIADKRHYFILDTGSNMTVFGPELKSLLSPTGEKLVINQGEALELYDCPPVVVGRSEFAPGGWVICADVTFLQGFAGHRISGMIGIDFLSGKLIQFDFDAGRLLLLKLDTRVAGERVPLHIGTDCLPVVDIDLPDGRTEPFLVDTACVGFYSGHLCPSTFDRLKSDAHLKVFDLATVVMSFEGTRQAREGELHWLSLAGARQETQFFIEDNTEDSQNSIGLGYLARFKVTLDLDNRVMYLEKGRRFNRVCPVNWAGVDIAITDGVPRIIDIERDGPAWESGLRPGDRLVSVAGIDVANLGLKTIGSLLQCSIHDPSTTNLRLMWGDTPFLVMKVPGRTISVQVLRPPDKEPQQFVVFRQGRRSAAVGR